VSKVPAPMEIKELREWAAAWAEQLLALEKEKGKVRSSAVKI